MKVIISFKYQSTTLFLTNKMRPCTHTMQPFDLTKVSYAYVAPGEVFFRSKMDPEDPRVELNQPFSRGIYVTEDPTVSCSYAFSDAETSVAYMDEYRLVNPALVLAITWDNINVLMDTLSSVPRLSLRNGATITSKEALDIIRRYCSFRRHGKTPLVIQTSDKGAHEVHDGKRDYLGHWFAHIVCFLGFQGYRVARGYMRKHSTIMFLLCSTFALHDSTLN